MKYRGNNICPDKRSNAADGQPDNIVLSPTRSFGDGIISPTYLAVKTMQQPMMPSD